MCMGTQIFGKSVLFETTGRLIAARTDNQIGEPI